MIKMGEKRHSNPYQILIQSWKKQCTVKISGKISKNSDGDVESKELLFKDEEQRA